MADRLILASSSGIRRALLRNAGVDFETAAARVDEAAVRAALIAEGAGPRDIADALAEAKARRIGQKASDALVVGCDQVLADGQGILAKPETRDAAGDQLRRLAGGRHQLFSAAVVYEDGRPVWRHIGVVRLQMREISEDYLEAYLARNWDSVRHSAGAYKLEEEGVRLFTRIDGDYFSVLGLPLVELLSYLTLRGVLPA